MAIRKIWGNKLALVVIDPQRKFTLEVPDWEERRDFAVKHINQFSKLFRERGAPVIFVCFDGESHCEYKGDDGEEWLQGIEIYDSDIIVHKEHMSCFKRTNLLEILQEHDVDCPILCGMLTEFCVVSTYYSAKERDLGAYIARDALIPYHKEGNEAAYLICGVVGLKDVEAFFDASEHYVSK